MTPDPFDIVLCLASAFLAGFVVGGWLANRRCNKELDQLEGRLDALGRRIDRVRG